MFTHVHVWDEVVVIKLLKDQNCTKSCHCVRELACYEESIHYLSLDLKS